MAADARRWVLAAASALSAGSKVGAEFWLQTRRWVLAAASAPSAGCNPRR